MAELRQDSRLLLETSLQILERLERAQMVLLSVLQVGPVELEEVSVSRLVKEVVALSWRRLEELG